MSDPPPAAPTRDAHTSATPPSSWSLRDRSNDHAHCWWARTIYTDALGATARRLTPSMRALPHAHRHRLNGHGCPGHPRPSQPLSRRLAHAPGPGGRSWAFPGPLSRLYGPSSRCVPCRTRHGRARGSPHRSHRSASRPSRQLPRPRPRPGCPRPEAGSPPSWTRQPRRWSTRRACGGSSRERSHKRSGECWEKRIARARMGLRAGSWRPKPRGRWRGQGAAAHPAPTM